jgi:hypothetical protein
MIKNSFSLFILLLVLNFSSFAQDRPVHDAQIWENISVSKDIFRNYNLHFNHEGRITNNASLFYYAYGDFGLTRILNKHFRITLDYVLVWKQTFTRTSWRHQWYVAGTFKQKFLKRFQIDVRSMYQKQYQDIYSSDLGRYPDDYLRNKITLKYAFEHYPFYRFSPYLATESYYHLNNNNDYGPEFDRMRYFAGVYYSFSKQQALEFYYLIEKNFNINSPSVNFVTGIGYSFDF